MRHKPIRDLLGLILIDLDGTAMDEDGNTDPQLPKVFERAVTGGLTLGWISRTSIDGLRRVEPLLGIKPGVMSVYCGEEGAVTIAPPGWLIDSPDGSFSHHRMLKDHQAWKDRYAALVSAVAEFCAAQGWHVIHDHASTWTRLTTTPPIDRGIVVCIDNTREVSFTCEIRACAGGNMFVNEMITELKLRPAIAHMATSLGIPTTLLESGFGWCDLPNHAVNKGNPLRMLRARVPRETAVWAFDNSGNGKSMAGIRGVTLVAVADSRDGLQKVADVVTKAPGPAGVVEIFQNTILPAIGA